MRRSDAAGFIVSAAFLFLRLVWDAAIAAGDLPQNARNPSGGGSGECEAARYALRGETEELVYPYVGNRVRPSTGIPIYVTGYDDQAYPKNLIVHLVIGGSKYRLKLKLNDQLLKLNVTIIVDRQLIAKTNEQCFYQGSCTSDDRSQSHCQAVISTCRGFSGFIEINRSTYAVKPFLDTQDKNIHCKPHVIQRVKLQSLSLMCRQAISHPDAGLALEVADSHLLSAGTISDAVQDKPEKIKLLKMAVLVDKAFFHASGTEDYAFDYILQLVNAADMYYRKLNLRISLVCYQLWKAKDEFAATRSARQNLQNLVLYLPKLRARHCNSFDAAVLLSGQQVDGMQAGSSVQDSICSQRAAAVVHTNASVQHLQHSAVAMAHHIGHVLGLLHDGHDCTCGDFGDCIMNMDEEGNGSVGEFSECSKGRMDVLWKYSPAACLSPRKQHVYASYCGNGLVERGEECDCGPPAKCHHVDPCCDASTCMLKTWATCKSGLCCQDCRVRNVTYACRAAKTECDAPEYCDGINSDCPPDMAVQDGEACAGSAHCYNGQCLRQDSQCEHLWGPGSRMSSDQCYLVNNPQGTEHGHCGTTGRNKEFVYTRCNSRNALCGLLQCTGGSSVPLSREVSYRIETIGISGIDQYECKTVSLAKDFLDKAHEYPLANASSYVVLDGTKCGEGSICIAQSCVSLASLPKFKSCPRGTGNKTCSGHGRCTSGGACYCDAGFDSAVCNRELTVTVVPRNYSATSPADAEHAAVLVGGPLETIELRWLIIIAVSLAVLMVGLVLITIFCVRQRRFYNRKQSASFDKGKRVAKKDCECKDSRRQCTSKNRNHAIGPKHDPTKRRRRRRFRKPLWSDSDSDSTSDEGARNLSPPIIIHNDSSTGDEHMRQPERGILKKKTLSLIGEERDSHARDDASLSSCSCPADACCSCSDNDDNEAAHDQLSKDCHRRSSPCAPTAKSDESQPMLLADSALRCNDLSPAAGSQHAHLLIPPRDDSGRSNETSVLVLEGTAVPLGDSHCSTCKNLNPTDQSRFPCCDRASQLDSATDSAVELCDALLVTSSMSTLNEACIISTAPTSRWRPMACSNATAAPQLRDSSKSCRLQSYVADCPSGATCGSERAMKQCETMDCLQLYELAARELSPQPQAKRSISVSSGMAAASRTSLMSSHGSHVRASYSSDSGSQSSFRESPTRMLGDDSERSMPACQDSL